MKINQRFIAGAKCPKCEGLDSLLLNLHDQSIECVDCGYQQTEAERDHHNNGKIAETLVNKILPKKVEISNVIRVTNIKE